MDPVSLIVAALALGVSTGVTDTVSQAVKDSYHGLKDLVKRRFAGTERAEQTLEEFIADPDTYEKPLAMQLVETGADSDEAILIAAKELLKQAHAAGLTGKYNITVTGGKVGIIGDHGHIDTMN